MKVRFIILLIYFLLANCAFKNLSQYTKLAPLAPGDKRTFSFTVGDEVLDQIQSSEMDEDHPLITKFEAKILIDALEENEYCLDEEGEAKFIVTSKQERVYDTTFAHVVSQDYENYSNKPIAPRIYYGTCYNNNNYVK